MAKGAYATILTIYGDNDKGTVAATGVATANPITIDGVAAGTSLSLTQGTSDASKCLVGGRVIDATGGYACLVQRADDAGVRTYFQTLLVPASDQGIPATSDDPLANITENND